MIFASNPKQGLDNQTNIHCGSKKYLHAYGLFLKFHWKMKSRISNQSFTLHKEVNIKSIFLIHFRDLKNNKRGK